MRESSTGSYEGLLLIAERSGLAVANESELGEREAPRRHVQLFPPTTFKLYMYNGEMVAHTFDLC
jgi:hypothetical protein